MPIQYHNAPHYASIGYANATLQFPHSLHPTLMLPLPACGGMAALAQNRPAVVRPAMLVVLQPFGVARRAGQAGGAMKGRRTPPPIVFALPRDDDPSQAVDAAFFERYPNTREYSRMYIPGETVEPMHPDTWVWVKMIGAERVRGFAPPAQDRLN